MTITIKSSEEIALMREAGRILAKVHQDLGKEIKPGMSTLDIDRLGEEMIRSFGCIPSFKNYCGYPASICVSVNDEVVHGIPTDKRIIEEGDIVSLDAELSVICVDTESEGIFTKNLRFRISDSGAGDRSFAQE